MPYTEEERQRCAEMGADVEKVYFMDDLVKSNEVYFAATGISNGELLKGVVFTGANTAKTHSVVMRSETGTIRFIDAIHRFAKKPSYAY